MGCSSVLSSHRHIVGYEEREKVREADNELSRCLQNVEKQEDFTECFKKAMEALEKIAHEKVSDITPRIGKTSENSVLPDGAPFVSEEMKRIIAHPQAQNAISSREQERFIRCLSEWKMGPPRDCWGDARKRLEEIANIQEEKSEGSKEYKTMIGELRNKAFKWIALRG